MTIPFVWTSTLKDQSMTQLHTHAPTGGEIGQIAPDFELKDESGKTWRLSDHRGKVVALVFYPRDETPVCTKQMCSMRDRWEDYQATGAEVVAISVGSEQRVDELTSRPIPPSGASSVTTYRRHTHE